MIKVGGEVDSLCGRCELVLAHTVHAVVGGRPVKVECNTCHSVHRYRQPPGSARVRPGPSRAARPAREKPVAVPFDSLLAARNVARARRYSPRDTYAIDDVVDHPTFGRGFVSGMRDGAKLEVTFRTDVKVLVHGRA
jgi:hypothetical protein